MTKTSEEDPFKSTIRFGSRIPASYYTMGAVLGHSRWDGSYVVLEFFDSGFVLILNIKSGW